MPHLHTVRLSYRSYIYPLRWTPSNFVEELTRKTMRPMAKEMIFSMFSFIAHKFQPHLPSCVLKTLSLWSHVSCKSIVVAEGGGRFYLGHHHHCELCGLPSCYVWLAILSHKAAAIRQNQAATSIYLFIHLSKYKYIYIDTHTYIYYNIHNHLYLYVYLHTHYTHTRIYIYHTHIYITLINHIQMTTILSLTMFDWPAEPLSH